MTRIPIIKTPYRYFASYYHKNHEYIGRFNYFCNVDKELFDLFFRNNDYANYYYLIASSAETHLKTFQILKSLGVEVIEGGNE